MTQQSATPTSSTDSSSPSRKPFRVVIAGAGAAGLCFSHALQRAGIDHVVLEKGVVAPEWGASISLWGNGARILSQIGCMEALEAEALPLRMLHVRGPDGKVFCEEPFFDMMLERYVAHCNHEQRPGGLRNLAQQRVQLPYDGEERFPENRT